MSTELPIATNTDVGGLKTGGDITLTDDGVAQTPYQPFLDLNHLYITIGAPANNQGGQAVAIGGQAQIRQYANQTVAIGYASNVAGQSALACGANANAEADSSSALGFAAHTTSEAFSAVALGESSLADTPNTVSVGNPHPADRGAPLLRRIVNVEDAQDDNDAVTLGQVQRLVKQEFAAMAAQMSSAGNRIAHAPAAPQAGLGAARSTTKWLGTLCANLKNACVRGRARDTAEKHEPFLQDLARPESS